jgi:hypothetical protein
MNTSVYLAVSVMEEHGVLCEVRSEPEEPAA